MIFTMINLAAFLYLCVAWVFLARSGSRGFVVDVLFAALWPYYLIRHCWCGR